MASSAQDLWAQILTDIETKTNPQIFQAWFKPLFIESISETSLSIRVPDAFFKDWLLDHHLETLQEGVRNVLKRECSISLSVAPPGTAPVAGGSPDPRVEDLSPALPAGGESEGEGKVPPASREISNSEKGYQSGLNPKYTFDAFVVGSSNRFAHAASLAVCHSPAKTYNPLFIYGGVGLGKTHLMHSIGHEIARTYPVLSIVYTSSENFTNQLIAAIQNRSTEKFRKRYRNVDILIIDDIHFIAGKESTQEAFFHTFNTLYDAHKQIIICSDRPPKEIPGLEERLVSRFEWGLVTDIQPPELETRIAILKKKAERETVLVPNEVFFLIAERVKSNIRELEGALIRVVAYSKLIGEPISVNLTKNVLKDMFVEEKKKITVVHIQKKVSDFFDISVSDLRGKRKLKEISHPRQIGMYLARKLTEISLSEIGNYFGGRDHTTILHAYEKISKQIKSDKKLLKTVETLEKDLVVE